MRTDRVFLLMLLCTYAVLTGSVYADVPSLGQIADFHLVERSGRPVTRQDLMGRVWVVDFIYTTCPGPCPLLSQHMAGLQKTLPPDDRLGFLSISVDPANDTPAVLSRYATLYGADPKRWWFLTGTASEIDTLLRSSFHVAVDSDTQNLMHSQYFALVDETGRIRGYYDILDSTAGQRLTEDVSLTLGRIRPAAPWSLLPSVNAVLNGVSALLVLAGVYFIKRREVTSHRACMLGALFSSCLFLTSYLVYHAHVGSIPFEGPPGVRHLYLSILFSHTLLALVTVPLVVTTLSRALKGHFDLHVRIAQWTFPIWLYVSCTGVVVYIMLYHWSMDAV